MQCRQLLHRFVRRDNRQQKHHKVAGAHLSRGDFVTAVRQCRRHADSADEFGQRMLQSVDNRHGKLQFVLFVDGFPRVIELQIFGAIRFDDFDAFERLGNLIEEFFIDFAVFLEFPAHLFAEDDNRPNCGGKHEKHDARHFKRLQEHQHNQKKDGRGIAHESRQTAQNGVLNGGDIRTETRQNFAQSMLLIKFVVHCQQFFEYVELHAADNADGQFGHDQRLRIAEDAF